MSRRRRIIILAALLISAGIGALFVTGAPPFRTGPPYVPVPAADAAKFVGTYYNGDGLGTNIHLTLKPDGSYAATWHGCGGLYGEASGNWRVQQKAVVLSPFAETDMMKGHLRTLEIVDAGKDFLFVRPEDERLGDLERLKEGASDANQWYLRCWTFQREKQVFGKSG